MIIICLLIFKFVQFYRMVWITSISNWTIVARFLEIPQYQKFSIDNERNQHINLFFFFVWESNSIFISKFEHIWNESKIKRRAVQNACMWGEKCISSHKKSEEWTSFLMFDSDAKITCSVDWTYSLLLIYRYCIQMRWRSTRLSTWKVYAFSHKRIYYFEMK